MGVTHVTGSVIRLVPFLPSIGIDGPPYIKPEFFHLAKKEDEAFNTSPRQEGPLLAVTKTQLRALNANPFRSANRIKSDSCMHP